jgi:hypothetical protein
MMVTPFFWYPCRARRRNGEIPGVKIENEGRRRVPWKAGGFFWVRREHCRERKNVVTGKRIVPLQGLAR